MGSVSKRAAAPFQMVNLISQLIDFSDEPFLGEKWGPRLVCFNNTELHTQNMLENLSKMSSEMVDIR